MKNSDQYVQLNIQNQNTKRTLLGKVSLVRNDMPNNYEAGAVNYAGEDKLSQQFKSQTDQYALKPAINLYGSFNLSENQLLETSVGGSYTNNEYSRNASLLRVYAAYWKEGFFEIQPRNFIVAVWIAWRGACRFYFATVTFTPYLPTSNKSTIDASVEYW